MADPLTQDEIGRAYGGQVLLRQELLRGFFGWITYSLTRSERRDHPNTDWRLFDFDQTQALGVVASYQLGHGWEVGTRFRYTTGFPRTPGRQLLSGLLHGAVQPALRAVQLDPDSRVLSARRAHRARRSSTGG